MKILLLNKLYYPWIGGVETVVRQLAENISKKKSFEVEVLAVAESKTADGKKVINGVSVVKTPLNMFYGSQPISFALIRALKSSSADVIHMHFPDIWGSIAYLLARPSGKLVVTYHSDIIRQKLLRIILWPLIMYFLAKAERIVTTSPKLLSSSMVLKFFKQKTSVIPLALEETKYVLEPKSLQKIKNKYGRNFILAVGRFVGYKGYEYLLKAMKYVDPKNKLIIIGEGKLEKKYRRIIAENNLQDRVTILKSIPFTELKAFYALCSIFVLPSVSNNEAFGLVQLEAMFFNKPVVSTDLPTGVSWVNKDKRTGLICRKKDPWDLAEKINRLSSDDRLYRKCSGNNKEYVKKMFSLGIMIESYSKLYNQLRAER